MRFSDAQQKEENQIKAIRSFIAQGVDVIAFSPVVETGFEPVLQEAKKAGIPVVLSDRAVKVSDDSLYKCFLGSDFIEEGKRAANEVLKLTGGKAGIAELVGTVGSAPAIDLGRKVSGRLLPAIRILKLSCHRAATLPEPRVKK